MDLTVPPELEELILCSCCNLPFNDSDCVPKLFTCRHYFCLKCVNSLHQEGSDELYCVHCWKRTALPGPDARPDSLPTYNAILYLTQNLNTLNIKSTTQLQQQQQRNSIGSSGGGKQRSSSITSQSSNGGGSGGNNSSSSNNNNGSNGNLSGIAVDSRNNGNSNNIAANELHSNSNNKIKLGENCMTHAMPNTLWCSKCNMLLCRACAATEEHRTHAVKNQLEAKESMQTDIGNELLTMQKTLNDVQHLVLKQRDFLLKILESCTALKTQIETELINHLPTLEIAEMRESLGKARLCLDMLEQQTPAEALKLYTTLHVEKQRLMAKYQEMFLQCKLDELIRNYGYVFDFDLIKQALLQLHSGNLESFGGISGGGSGLNGLATHHNPVLLLANYCISQLYSRQMLLLKQQQQQQQQQQHQQQQQKHQQQQQLQQQQQHALLSNGGNHAKAAVLSLGFGSSSYAQALQQSGGPASPRESLPQIKSYADITTASPKANQQLHHPSQQQHHQQQQQQSSQCNNGFGELGAIGALRCATSNLFPSSSGSELSGLGLSMFHLQQQQQQQSQQQQHSKSPMLLNPSVHVYPIYYFNLEINGQPSGRVLIEVRNDVAPKMSKNFGALATNELGFGYKGCHIFQCWESESIITGDFELNNGRGGRSVYDEGFFMPDDTKILAIRGSVGMRRSQKRHDNLGLVGSQFRIILREMRGFTGIFAFVVDGLELVEKISQAGDSAGKPQSNVVIVSCGKYQLGG